MSDDKNKKQISKCPPPITPLRGGGYIPPVARTLPRGAWKQPNWNFWKYMPEVKTWQACALALNFDPDSLELIPYEYMTAYVDDEFQSRSFPSDEVMRQHENLLLLLAANRYNAEFFTHAYNLKDLVRLSEFAAWCAPVVRDLTGGDIPEELAALAKAAPQAAAKIEAIPVTSPSGDDWIEKARAIADRIGLEKYRTGMRQITVRSICDAVATELALDQTTWGLQGARSADYVRTKGLRGWKFTPPKEAQKVD